MPLLKQIVLNLFPMMPSHFFGGSGTSTLNSKRVQSKSIFCAFLTITLIFLSSGLNSEARESGQPFDFLKKTIVIDPGHGGRDTGAKGPEGTFEKTITLALAKMIAAELEKNYRVVLTRTGDYRLDLTERTSTANHLKADLFMSIHTGASLLHTVNGRSIFYYKSLKAPVISDETETSTTSQDNTPVPWNTLWQKHKAASRKLAEILKNHLAEDPDTALKIQEVPVLILEGAAMPAILFETGYITNPAQEKKLNNKQALYDLAQKISSGIHEFLTHQQ